MGRDILTGVELEELDELVDLMRFRPAQFLVALFSYHRLLDVAVPHRVLQRVTCVLARDKNYHSFVSHERLSSFFTYSDTQFSN